MASQVNSVSCAKPSSRRRAEDAEPDEVGLFVVGGAIFECLANLRERQFGLHFKRTAIVNKLA